MGNGYAQPIQPPRPAYCSLPAAVKAAIDHGNTLLDIKRPDLWATTYGCLTEDVRHEFERQMSEASMRPSNSFDVEGK
jgi:hypothetical protein